MTKKNTDIKKRINTQSPSKVQAISMEDVQDKIIILRGQRVLLDRDVAELYGVGTKEINQAVKNNPKKFPYGFIFGVDEYEKDELVKNFDRFNSLKHSLNALKLINFEHFFLKICKYKIFFVPLQPILKNT